MTEEENVLSYLVGDGLSKGVQILIFCPSKLNCSQTCTALIEILCPEIDVVTENKSSSNNFISSNNVKSNEVKIVSSDSNKDCGSGSGIAADSRTAHPTQIDKYRDCINSRQFVSHQRYSTHAAQTLNRASTNYSISVQAQAQGSEAELQAQIQSQRKKEELRSKIQADRLSSISDLLASDVNSDPGLLGFLSNGFAFHHAGLTLDERNVVETAFRTGSLNRMQNSITNYWSFLFKLL